MEQMHARHLLLTLTLALTLGLSGAAQTARATQTAMEVFKTSTCGCCGKWVEHMRAAGFAVTFTDIDQAELDRVKAKHGVARELHSCHTALVDGYVIEGHVPASEVRRLLTERPKVAGLAVPGMPLGSPGMEVSGVKAQPYDVLSFQKNGGSRVFSTIKP